MPAAARKGDAITTGHGCDATSAIKGSLQSKVYSDGIIAAVSGDSIEAHTIESGNTCIAHAATVGGGSSKVFMQGNAAARKGDSADAGVITAGSSKVFIG